MLKQKTYNLGSFITDKERQAKQKSNNIYALGSAFVMIAIVFTLSQ